MTNSSTEKQWRITVTIDTALCIGDSGASETSADKSTVKTSDGKLYIPASTLKGIWRHACEVIAPSMGNHSVCNSPRAENMCVNNHCIICQIFGSPTLESRIFISDLTLDGDLGIETTAIRSGVTINRNRRVAEDQRLYFTETSLPNAGFEFSGDVTISGSVKDDQIELLSAGLNYIHAIGSGKTRGLGWLKIKREETTLPTQEIQSIETDSEAFTELSIKVTLESPIITGGRKPAGQAVEAVQYIRGGLIRGAVAKAWLADLKNGEPDNDFKQLFINDDAGIFQNCTPGTKVLPATAVGCKDFPGFLAKNDTEKHGIFDTLFKKIVSEKAGWMYQPNCPNPDCEGRVESQGGFYEDVAGSYEKRHLNTRLLTRVAINRQRKVAADELLYHLTSVDPLSTDGKEVCLQGTVQVPSALTNKVADTLQKRVKRLGGGSSRGLGKVSLEVKKHISSDMLAQRIDDFNKALQAVWDVYSQLPHIEIGAFEGIYFSVNLQSDAILTAEDGWQRSMVLTTPMLKQMTNCETEVTFIRSFASYGYVGGWNAAWGLPKETDLVTQMGSVFVFHTPDIDSWISALQTLENIGIGNRREEGFGQITTCDPFHLRTREQVKSEAAWLVNEEESK